MSHPSPEQQSSSGSGSCNLYVKNFGKELSDDGLRQLFQSFGMIISARIMRDDNGKSKCFGFVSFKAVIEAEDAIRLVGIRFTFS